jgi:hypothetical protein
MSGKEKKRKKRNYLTPFPPDENYTYDYQTLSSFDLERTVLYLLLSNFQKNSF